MTQNGNVYAEALFALACEYGGEEEALLAMKEMDGVLSTERELVTLLSAPAIPAGERLAVARKVFGNAPEHVFSLLCLLCETRKVETWGECVRAYERLWEEHAKQSVAAVTVARPMNEEEQKALRDALEKKSGRHVRLDVSVDPAVLGGVIVEMDGTVTDGSLRRRLQQVKEGLTR